MSQYGGRFGEGVYCIDVCAFPARRHSADSQWMACEDELVLQDSFAFFVSGANLMSIQL